MAKISLCMIVGNVSDYIERCLLSFLPIADEVCLVRAIGCQTPDATEAIARRVCAAANVPLRWGEYQNAPGHEAWPHVDHFAAARQQSFDLATGDYCFWCDSDDILKSGAAAIRRHAQTGGYACFIFPYDIFGKNVVVPRERMLLKDSGRWEHAVHEAYKFKVEPPTAALDDSVVIQHLPRLDKGERELAAGGATGNQRNLRILESIPPEQLTPGLKYHLFGELICAGRTPEAIDLGVKLIATNELGKDERYDLLMSLYLQTPSLQDRVTLAHAAHQTDPERREALGVLACTMLDLGRPTSALAYARQMIATPTPEVQSWNSRQSFYGYVGDDIYQQALRSNGRFEDADTVRKFSLQKAGGPRIALLHATRGRPEKAAKARKAWHDLAANPGSIEHIFAIDEDDAESRVLKRFHHIVCPAGGGCVAAWNYAAQMTAAPVLVQLSDDWLPVPKWDELILQRLGDVERPAVLAISDDVRADDLLCMAICTRAYYNLDFFLFHPAFTGVYSDNWFTELAYARKCVIEARDIHFQHQHPIATGAPLDATYAAQNAPERYVAGQQIIARLRTGQDWSTIPGWFNYWIFYQQVAANLPDGAVVAEVGNWFGRSLCFLAQECRRLGKRVKFYAIDTFRGELNQPEHQDIVAAHGGSIRSAFEANLAKCGVAEDVTILEGDSAAMAAAVADGTLDFCYIDAAHDYASVRRDIAAWLPKVKPAGCLAGHDAQHEEVVRAVKELLPAAAINKVFWMHRP
jgi:hypothetical protein